MQITDLKYRQRRTGNEVTVELDDNSTLALDAEVAVRFHLARGMEISEDFKREICSANEILTAKRKLIHYLSLRKKSTADARRYLRRRGFGVNASDEAVQHALSLNYLDDTRFADAFVRTRVKAGTKGPLVVKNELRAHGIPADDAKKAVESLADRESQMEMARKVAAKKYPSIKDSEDLVKASRKLAQHLARRGFEPDICDVITREFFGDPTQF